MMMTVCVNVCAFACVFMHEIIILTQICCYGTLSSWGEDIRTIYIHNFLSLMKQSVHWPTCALTHAHNSFPWPSDKDGESELGSYKDNILAHFLYQHTTVNVIWNSRVGSLQSLVDLKKGLVETPCHFLAKWSKSILLLGCHPLPLLSISSHKAGVKGSSDWPFIWVWFVCVLKDGPGHLSDCAESCDAVHSAEEADGIAIAHFSFFHSVVSVSFVWHKYSVQCSIWICITSSFLYYLSDLLSLSLIMQLIKYTQDRTALLAQF